VEIGDFNKSHESPTITLEFFRNVRIGIKAFGEFLLALVLLDLFSQAGPDEPRDLGILFNFAVSRRWTAENPCAFIEKPSELDREVVVLRPDEASKLLAACPAAFLPGVCLKLFAGLRTSELLSVDWSGLAYCHPRSKGEDAPEKDSSYFGESRSLVATPSQALRASRSVLTECVASLARNYRGICRPDAFAQRPSAQLRKLSLRAAPKRKSDRRRDGKFPCDGLPALQGDRHT